MSQRTTEFAAKITGDADGALAALEKVKVRVRETATATASANTAIGNSTGLLVKNSEKAAKGVASITQALYALEAEGSSRVLALGGAVGAFADLLGPGGKVVSGIAIVASSIVALFLQAKEKSAEARKAIENDINTLVNAGDVAGLNRRLRELAQGTAGNNFEDGITATQRRIALLQQEYSAAGKVNRYYLDRAERIREEKEKLEELETQYKAVAAAIESGRAAQQNVTRGLEGRAIIGSADSDEAIARRAKASTDAAQKSAEAFKKAYSDSLFAVQSAIVEAERELAELQASGIKRLEEESKARADGNAELQAQVIALGEGRAAYEELLIVQAQAEEIAKAEAAATAAKLTLSDAQIEQIRTDIRERARLLKLAQALRDLDGENPFTLPETSNELGRLAEDMAMVASAAAGIATAFGEAGRNIAAVLGQTGQLLTNLQRAQKAGVFTDLNGKEQNVGFFGALSGKAGAAGTAAAVSSTLGIIGATVAIADAVDLFGVRAREQARAIRERALAFNRALEDFAITDRTDLQERLRQNLASANQAAGAAGFTVDFQSVADIQAEANRIRAIAATSFKQARAQLRDLAAQLDALAKTAAENEAKLKAANEAAITRLREDLEVRRIAATQGAAAGAAARADLDIRRQELELRQQYGEAFAAEYIGNLRTIIAAENAIAEARAAQAAILQRLSDDDAFLGGTTTERLRRGFSALGEAFADFAGVFGEFDLSTAAGLTGAKDKIREIYQSLAVDGISEAERPIVDFLRTLLGNIDGALADLPETLDPIATALEAFGERVRLFGTSIPQQLAELRTIFGGRFGDLLDEILTSADLGSAEGRAAFKDAIAAQLEAILADGVISESERALYDVLVQLFGVANQAIADAEADAARIVQDAATARQRRRANAANRIGLFDLTGLDAFAETLQGLGPAFAGLFETFDLNTIEGIDGAKGVLRGIFDELTALSDEQILSRFGLTRDELVAALLDTDTGLDGLKGTLGDLTKASLEAARAAAEFADQIEQDFLRSQGRGQDADVLAAQARRDARLKQAAQLGLGPDILAQIEAIFQSDLAEIASRYAPAITATVDAASALAPSGGAGSGAAAAEARARSARRSTTVVGDFGGFSEITAQSLAGLLREIAINTGDQGAIVSALIGRGALRPLSSLSFPARPAGGAGAGGVVISIGAIHIGSLNPLGMSPTDAANTTAREIARQLGRLVGQETRFLGSGVA